MSSALALLSAALYGAADFLGGLASRHASTTAVVLLSQGAGLALLAGLLPVLPEARPSTLDLAWGGAAGIAGGAGVGLLYRALAIGTMAVVAPTTAVFAVVIPVLAALLLGERPAPVTLAGIGLAIVAVALISRQGAPAGEVSSPDAAGLPRGFPQAVLAGVAIGLFYLALARTSADAGLWPLVSARAASVTLFGAVTLARSTSLRVTGHVAALILAAGLLDMGANAVYLLAARTGPLSAVVALASLYPASTVILARVVLAERLSAPQKVGIACAIAAVLLIVTPGA